jgi:hypothetical protein
MQNLKIEGIGTINGGEYGYVGIEGIGKCAGDIHSETLSIEGVFNSTGSIRTGRLECEGVATVDGNVFAVDAEIDGILTLKGGKLEATTILCDGVIKVNGQISADRIEADGVISANEIVGDNILIESPWHLFGIFTRGHCNRSRISLIEATTVSLVGVRAEQVSGKDVSIGRGCRVERVDCSGNLYISPNARVGSVSGTYTKREN